MILAKYISKKNMGMAMSLRLSIIIFPLFVENIDSIENESIAESILSNNYYKLVYGVGPVEQENLTFFDEFLNNLNEIIDFTDKVLNLIPTVENCIIPTFKKTLKKVEMMFLRTEKKAIFFDLINLIMRENVYTDENKKLVNYIIKEFNLDSETVKELSELAEKIQSLNNNYKEILD